MNALDMVQANVTNNRQQVVERTIDEIDRLPMPLEYKYYKGASDKSKLAKDALAICQIIATNLMDVDAYDEHYLMKIRNSTAELNKFIHIVIQGMSEIAKYISTTKNSDYKIKGQQAIKKAEAASTLLFGDLNALTKRPAYNKHASKLAGNMGNIYSNKKFNIDNSDGQYGILGEDALSRAYVNALGEDAPGLFNINETYNKMFEGMRLSGNYDFESINEKANPLAFVTLAMQRCFDADSSNDANAKETLNGVYRALFKQRGVTYPLDISSADITELTNALILFKDIREATAKASATGSNGASKEMTLQGFDNTIKMIEDALTKSRDDKYKEKQYNPLADEGNQVLYQLGLRNRTTKEENKDNKAARNAEEKEKKAVDAALKKE